MGSSATVEKNANIKEALRLGFLLAEKCELIKAIEVFEEALKKARKARNNYLAAEALSSLLWLFDEARDETRGKQVEKELDAIIKPCPHDCPPLVWYCKGAIARNRNDFKTAHRHYFRYLKLSRAEDKNSSGGRCSRGLSRDAHIARGWCMIAVTQLGLGRTRRAEWLCLEILRRYGPANHPSVNGTAHLTLAFIAESLRDWRRYGDCLQKASECFLTEHNWYYHLYVMKAQARLARLQQNYVIAYWHLDLLSKIAAGPSFAKLRREIATERNRLEQDAVDLLIDSRKGVVKTRDGGVISLRKQYILLGILEALTGAHSTIGNSGEKGLSKAELIEKVWGERYIPEAHDNKLYYNINRLRKLIEPDMREPQYLQNWKEGYRLAPGLKVQFLGDGSVLKQKGET